jgi:uncharacterized protein (TIGR02145 family)
LPTGTINGPGTLCESAQQIQYQLSGTDPLATSFLWEINPALAGTITGNNATPTITLNTGFSGNFGIRFKPVSSCGEGNFSSYSNINVSPAPQVTLRSCNDPVTTRGSQPFRLKGGLPLGGTYSVDGTQLPTGILNPAALSSNPPDHVISYTYANQFNCAATKTRTIKVFNTSNFSCKNLLTDIRDLKSYPTFEVVTAGISRCWMSSNLNYGGFIQGQNPQTDNCVIEKYCQGNNASACTESGGLYQWDELMDYLPSGNFNSDGKQGICPPEWHVATETEWTALINYYQSPGIAGWNLLDPDLLWGFHAKTFGVLYQNNVWGFLPPGFSATIFWTSSFHPDDKTKIYSHGLNEINPSVSTYFSTRGNALPLRCVKD